MAWKYYKIFVYVYTSHEYAIINRVFNRQILKQDRTLSFSG